MPTYTVHAPPQRNAAAADPQRFEFVRDGFHFWAFLLAPLWLLYRRLWLVFIGYLLLMLVMEVAFYFLRLPEGSRIVIDLLLGVLVGLEAGTLRRWTYARRKWTILGVVSADNRESAERRFFTQWVERAAEPPTLPQPAIASAPVRAGGNDIIGLFPEPGGRS